MSILREELPNIEVVVRSEQSPDLANALMRRRVDVAFLRREERVSGLVYNLAMAISLVASTGGVSLLPLYARNMLPPQ